MSDAGSRHLPPLPPGALLVLDLVLVMAASWLARFVSVSLPPLPGTVDAGPLPANTWMAWVLARVLLIGMGLMVLDQHKLLRDPRAHWSFPRILLVVSATTFILLAFLMILEVRRIDTTFVLLEMLATLAFLTAWRGALATRIRQEVQWGVRVRNALFVGEGAGLRGLARHLVATPMDARRVMGFVGEPGPAPHIGGIWNPGPVQLDLAVVENSLRQPRHLWVRLPGEESARPRIIDGLGIEELYLAASLPPATAQEWIRLAQERGIDAHIVPDSPLGEGAVPHPWELGGHVVLDVHRRPLSLLGWWVKRGMDVAGGLVGMALALPIVLVAAVAIKVEDPKLPVFYGGTRVGLKGRHFKQWKLATMRRDADSFRAQLQAKNAREGPWFQLDEKDDPRISRVGRFLRKYSLNDLPQFWNVVKGDMSLVGPRPLASDEASRFVEYDFRYYRCFDVKPGLTGLWQISNRMEPSFQYRVDKDFEYIEQWSVWMDLRILLETPVAMIRGGR